MAVEPVIFQFPGAVDLLFNSLPSQVIFDPSANASISNTAGDNMYSYQEGAQNALITVVFDKDTPLSFKDYFGGFDIVTRIQVLGTQSLANWYLNVCMGPLNQFTLKYFGKAIPVNLINAPSLGFKPLPKQPDKYVGQLLLRLQY